MIERIQSAFHPFVLPFMLGMVFVLTYCIVGMIRIWHQLEFSDRKKVLKSLLTPASAWKNIKDIFLNCLIHVNLWKRNKMLGFMHSSIAFGWFMLILLGHIEVYLFVPHRLNTFYYAIFFNYFVAETESTIQGAALFFLMDLFLLLVLSGIALAVVKRFRSRFFGMRRTTRLTFLDSIGLYSLWMIFPLRLLAEGFTVGISGGSFLTYPVYWAFHSFLGDHMNMLPTWWAYSIVLCVFMCVLPFTRYMHIPAEMMLIPLRNAGLTIKDARKGFAKVQVLSCPGCGVCIDACPMTARRTFVKDTTVYLNRNIRKGNEKRIEEISDRCLLCGKCTTVCQVGLNGPMMRIAQRATRQYSINQDYSNIDLGQMKVKVSGGSRPVLYFAGCMTQLTPAIATAVQSVLNKAGVPFEYMDKDGGLCCGRPMLMAGRFKQAWQLIGKNTEIIKASGCDTLLLSCPICYKVFKEQYSLDDIRVVHHSQYFYELMKSGQLKLEKGDIRYVYHDPCELGRGCGIYEEPRKLLGCSGYLVEAEKHHQESICCGGSLGSLTLSDDQRLPMTKNALQNLVSGGPDVIATACPLCKTTFRRFADRPVQDIAEIIDRNS